MTRADDAADLYAPKVVELLLFLVAGTDFGEGHITLDKIENRAQSWTEQQWMWTSASGKVVQSGRNCSMELHADSHRPRHTVKIALTDLVIALKIQFTRAGHGRQVCGTLGRRLEWG
jgi:hypothetical protein